MMTGARYGAYALEPPRSRQEPSSVPRSLPPASCEPPLHRFTMPIVRELPRPERRFIYDSTW
jgi:hypothetical protein